MARHAVLWIVVFAGIINHGTAAAQMRFSEDLPALHVPIRADSPEEITRLEALHAFAEGALWERQDRLNEALRCYEQAALSDPAAVSIQKALVAIYITLERHEQATAAIQKVLQLDPHQAEMSYLYARLLRNRDKLEEARNVLKNGLQSPHLADRSDLHHQMEYELAGLYERLQQYAEAAKAFDRAAALLDHPDVFLEARMAPDEIIMRAAEEHESAGRNWMEAGNYGEAVTSFGRAQAKYPAGAARQCFLLAQVNLRQGKTREALEFLNQYLQSLPQGTDGYELMISLMRKSDQGKQILPWLEQAATRDLFNVGLQMLFAKECEQAGELEKAEKILKKLIDNGPTSQIYQELFRVYIYHDPLGAQRVVELLNNALVSANRKDNPPGPHASPIQIRAAIAALRENDELARPVLRSAADLATSGALHLDSLQIFAAVADHLEMLNVAEVLYSESIKQPLPPATEGLIYGGMLRVLWKSQRYEAVVETCRKALKETQASNRVVLRVDLARALTQLQRWDEAITEADLAILDARDTERFTVRLMKARLLAQADRGTLAEKECLALLKDSPMPGDTIEVQYLLSGIYSAQGKVSKAEAALEECLKIDADNATINNDLGFLWAEQKKRLPEAEAMIRKAIQVDRKNRSGVLAMSPGVKVEFRDNACFLDSLGWVLYREGKVDEAAEELLKACALPDGNDPVIWDHLGEVYAALGQKPQAIAAWRKALDFYADGKRRNIEERVRVLRAKMKQLQGTTR